jgi:hypothetical protein
MMRPLAGAVERNKSALLRVVNPEPRLGLEIVRKLFKGPVRTVYEANPTA